MLRTIILSAVVLAGVVFIPACSDKDQDQDNRDQQDQVKKPAEKPVIAPSEIKFNEDSAYAFIQKQVDFGPRVPGTAAHSFAGKWLADKLRSYCDTVYIQDGKVLRGERQVPIMNIIGSFYPDKKERVLLAAHWDTRPMADEDPDRPDEPADGANDGGSGVGVLLEIARQFHNVRPNIGVDIILFDAEDGGSHEGGILSWCLGSQYWSKVHHVKNYDARYGILLDMVGAEDAVFPYEGHSASYAGDVLRKVWQTGQKLGYGRHFINVTGSLITDDHIFINQEAGIPTIDIIHHDFVGGTGFGEYWHTHKDNMDIIHKPTLRMVGLTVLHVVYRER